MSVHEFKLPDVGEGLREGELIKWYVAVGDVVKVDQIICEVQTDKAIVEIPAPVAGTVSALGGKPGEFVDVGAMLACFEVAPGLDRATGQTTGQTSALTADRDTHAVSSAVGAAAANQAKPRTRPAASSTPPPVSLARPAIHRVKASPATRKLARQLGVDLNGVQASGDRGQVTRADVEAAVIDVVGSEPVPESLAAASRAGSGASPPASRSPAVVAAAQRPAGADREEPLVGLRRQVAQIMQAAWRDIPHIYSLREIDASALVAARRSVAADLEADGVPVTYMPFFVKACVLALTEHPRFNASLDMEAMRITYKHRINIGIATATPDGLIVTVVHDADRKSLAEIAVEIGELARLGRERKATLEQLSNGTFTISNYGSQGAWMGTPIIRPPEVAIAGFGRIEDKVVPVDGEPAVRKVLPMSVATDHRLNDGEHLGDFLNALVRYLGDPVRMLARL